MDHQLKEEPIAIVSIGCRFPGNVSSPEEFWQLLSTGVDASSEVPSSRWDSEKYYDPKPGTAHKAYTKRGSFISSVDEFDAAFFEISGREATFMDPQQRLLLETTWEAIENASLSPEQLQQMKTGVYIGCMNYDYAQLVAEAKDIDLHANSGTTPSALSGRLAHVFGLQGPVLTLDTACSSSLVCIHLAVQSLRWGESDIALVGGVNLQLTPFTTVMDCAAKMLSSDGRCKAFSDKADGFGRGDACGVVLMMKLSLAEKMKLPIISLVYGSAVNHDGAAGAMTVPNGPAQQAVMRAALKDAGLNPNDISYLEAHGTGTSLGDPIEINAIAHVYGTERANQDGLWVGSVKTNIGHSEAAAGIASLIKTSLMLKHLQIVPHLHFDQPSKKIPWSDLPIHINQELIMWPTSEKGKIYAGVSSFGLSGTNVHLILGHYQKNKISYTDASVVYPLCLSANTKPALQQQIQNYINFLTVIDDHVYSSVAYTSCVGRQHFSYRIALICENRQHALDQLHQLLNDNNYLRVERVPHHIHDCALVLPCKLTTQDSSWFEFLPYKEAWLDCEKVATSHGIKLKFEMRCDVNQTEQVIIEFAHAYSYGKLLLKIGIKPSLMIADSAALLAAAVLVDSITIENVFKLFKEWLVSEKKYFAEFVQYCIAKFSLAKPTIPIASTTSSNIYTTNISEELAVLFNDHQTEMGIGTLLDENDIFDLIAINSDSVPPMTTKLVKAYSCDSTEKLAQQLIYLLAKLHTDGYAISWCCLYEIHLPRVVLPTYPFQRQSYWVTKDENSMWQFTKKINDANQRKFNTGEFFCLPETKDIHFQLLIDPTSDNYWAQHKLDEVLILPGVLNIQVIMDFIHRYSSQFTLDITMLTFHQSPMIGIDTKPVYHAAFTFVKENEWSFKSYLQVSGHWTLLASAILLPAENENYIELPIDDLQAVQKAWKRTVTGEELYNIHKELGYHLKKPFQWLSDGWYAEGKTLRQINLSLKNDIVDYTLYSLYPGLIDSCMQCYDSNGHESAMNVEADKIYVPFHIRKLSFHASFDAEKPAYVYAVMKNTKEDYVDSSIGDIVLFQSESIIFKMEGVEYRKSNIAQKNKHVIQQVKVEDSFVASEFSFEKENLPPFEYCLAAVSHIMKIPKEQIDPEQTLSVMGLDSLMALEISAAIQEKFNIEVPLVMLLESASIKILANYIEKGEVNGKQMMTEQTSVENEISEIEI